MNALKIFLVEDDPWYGQILKHRLSLNEDFTVTLFGSGKECLAQLHLRPDIICVDYGLPDINGDELLEELMKWNPNLPVIVISGQEDIKVAVKLFKSGAREYLLKDENTTDLLWKSILNIRENVILKRENEMLKEELHKNFSIPRIIIGESPSIIKVMNLVDKAAKSNINVSITGETGTGKEVIAKSIHFSSERKNMPFVALNMAAIPSELIESELFGYEKGAFTGAFGRKSGKFEDANGGTLFLDEISELELSLQSKLLRVLQERELVRLGGNKKINIDVRLITATNRNLAEDVRHQKFREDLYYRIIGLPIELPPLRERGKDIVIFANNFIEEYARENKIKKPLLTKEAVEKLMNHLYPGNIRELKSIIDLACLMNTDGKITEDDIIFNQLFSQQFSYSEEKSMREYTVDIINAYLKKYDHNVLLVAEKLDISKTMIYDMLKQGKLKGKH